MFNFLPHWLRGLLVMIAIMASTLLLVPLVVVLAILKLAIPLVLWRKWCTVVLIEIATLWIGFNNLLLQVMHRIHWDIEGDDELDPNDWYFVTSNHQSWADILVVQKVLARKTPMLKFFLKQQLIWVPFIGIAWWALDFPFMKRYTQQQIARNPELRGKDLETTRRACEKFRYTPVAVFNFLEGTRFTPEKHRRQDSPYRYLLKPKAGGMAFVLGAMGDQLHTLLNVTIHYPEGEPRFWGLLSGRIRHIVVRIEQVPIPAEFRNRNYQEDETFRQSFQQWVSQLWREKDALLAELHTSYDHDRPASRR